MNRGFLTGPTRRTSRNGHPTDEWLITDAGREALKPKPAPTRRQRPLYIAEGWPDYTGDSSRKMRAEPEAVPPHELNTAWRTMAAERRHDATDRRETARRLIRNVAA